MAGYYTELGKNVMLDAIAKGTAPAVSITHCGLYQKTVIDAGGTNNFGGGDIQTSGSHGLSVGDIVVFTTINTSTNIGINRPYWVLSTPTAVTFTIGRKPGGSGIVPAPAMTTSTVAKITELSGGSPAYARKAIAYATAALGVSDDTTNGVDLDVPAGATVDYGGLFSASTSGTLLGLVTQTSTPYAAQGVYRFTDSVLDLNTVIL